MEIIDILHPGVVYLAKYIQGSQSDAPDLEALGSKLLVVKIIYSGITTEGYGKLIHWHLETHDMAPKYFFPFNFTIKDISSQDAPIESHHVMEYLPPPSTESPSWISLLELEE